MDLWIYDKLVNISVKYGYHIFSYKLTRKYTRSCSLIISFGRITINHPDISSIDISIGIICFHGSMFANQKMYYRLGYFLNGYQRFLFSNTDIDLFSPGDTFNIYKTRSQDISISFFRHRDF